MGNQLQQREAHLPKYEHAVTYAESSASSARAEVAGVRPEDNAGAAESSRMVWTSAEDHVIQSAVHSVGHRWRKIAAMLPNRSDDAVRNRWHRLELCRRYQEEKQRQIDQRGISDDAKVMSGNVPSHLNCIKWVAARTGATNA